MKCKVDNCPYDVFVLSRGLCKTHYHRQMRTGGLDISREPPNLNRMCKIAGCNAITKAKGLCINHYAELKRKGNFEKKRKRMDREPLLMVLK